MPTTDADARRRASMRRWSRLPVPARRALVTARRWRHPGRRPHPQVTVEMIDGIAVVTVDDGKVNAISQPMVQAFTRALDEVEGAQARAVVLTGRPGQFSAGFDLDALVVGGHQRDRLVLDGWDLLLRLVTLPLPLVVACSGNAVAAGAALLLTGDVRLGAEGPFRIGFNERAIGLPLPRVVLTLVRDRLHERAFTEATEGARLYRPPEAAEAGFLHRLATPSGLRAVAIDEAAQYEPGSLASFRRDKQARVGPLVEQMHHQLTDDVTLLRQIGT